MYCPPPPLHLKLPGNTTRTLRIYVTWTGCCAVVVVWSFDGGGRLRCGCFGAGGEVEVAVGWEEAVVV